MLTQSCPVGRDAFTAPGRKHESSRNKTTMREGAVGRKGRRFPRMLHELSDILTVGSPRLSTLHTHAAAGYGKYGRPFSIHYGS